MGNGEIAKSERAKCFCGLCETFAALAVNKSHAKTQSRSFTNSSPFWPLRTRRLNNDERRTTNYELRS